VISLASSMNDSRPVRIVDTDHSCARRAAL